jgi:hypothetical protein
MEIYQHTQPTSSRATVTNTRDDVKDQLLMSFQTIDLELAEEKRRNKYILHRLKSDNEIVVEEMQEIETKLQSERSLNDMLRNQLENAKKILLNVGNDIVRYRDANTRPELIRLAEDAIDFSRNRKEMQTEIRKRTLEITNQIS